MKSARVRLAGWVMSASIWRSGFTGPQHAHRALLMAALVGGAGDVVAIFLFAPFGVGGRHFGIRNLV